ncbi:MAG: hypothetical protein KAI96_08370 [Thermodesulfovibrionia bacterium]|nr:hypothetical protein [Thermodesulfovibrionia bacterium]
MLPENISERRIGNKMRKPRHSKNNHLTEREIEQFCQSTEEVLTKIIDRVSQKKKVKTKKSKETSEKELITCNQ